MPDTLVKPVFIHLLAIYLCLFACVQAFSQRSPEMNGFRLSGLTIPANEIKRGGPPKDGIPAIHHPKFVKGQNVSFLKPGDLIIGVEKDGEAKAYPVKILDWHEIVNDEIAGKPIVITYCPLCRSGVVFNAHVEGAKYTFGVSGLLYNSDVLLYDRETGSLWSQLMGASVAGSHAGKSLEMIASLMVSWEEWNERYPGTLVLSPETGYTRDYDRSPYARYDVTDELMFPVEHQNHVLLNKELVVGIEIEGEYVAFPFSRLRKKNAEKSYKGLRIQFDKKRQTAVVLTKEGNVYPSVTLYWFAWYTFHPDTRIFPSK